MKTDDIKEDYDKAYTTRVMLILAMLIMIVMYVEGMLTPSLLSIASDFNVSISQVSLLLSVYLVTGVSVSPIVGKLGDIYGKKRMLVIVLFIYAVAVVSTGFSPNFTYMLVSRGIQGIGLTVMPLGMSLVREEFPRRLVPKAQALLSAMFGAGFAVSLPLGSLVSNDLGWRYTYHTAFPFVFALVAVAYIYIRESAYRRPGTRVDYFGAVIFAVALGLVVFGLSEGALIGWTSITVIGMIMAGVILFVPTFLYERSYSKRGLEAILDSRLLSKRNVWIPNVVLAISGLGMFLAMQALTYRFESPTPYGFSLSILDTGLSLVPFAIGTLIFGPITGSIITRIGVKQMSVLGPLVAAAGFFLEAIQPSFTMTLVYGFVIGAGLSIMNASIINILVLSVEPRDMGLATSMNGTFRNLGSSVGASLAGAILATYSIAAIQGSPYDIPIPTHFGYEFSFLLAFGAFLVSAVIVAFAHEVIYFKGNKVADKKSELPKKQTDAA